MQHVPILKGSANEIEKRLVLQLNESLWKDLECFTLDSMQSLPTMSMILQYLDTLCFQKGLSYSGIKKEWPANPSEIGAFLTQSSEAEMNIFKAAKILCKYGHLMRKTNGKGEFYRGDIAKNPKIAKSYEESIEIVNAL